MAKKVLQDYLRLPYTIRFQVAEEGGFVAQVDELKGCATQGETIEETAKGIRDAMRSWIEVALKRGISVPEPEGYSGRFVLRLPKSLHRKLAESARGENSSLNQYLLYLLSERNALASVKEEMENAQSSMYQATHLLQGAVWSIAHDPPPKGQGYSMGVA